LVLDSKVLLFFGSPLKVEHRPSKISQVEDGTQKLNQGNALDEDFLFAIKK